FQFSDFGSLMLCSYSHAGPGVHIASGQHAPSKEQQPVPQAINEQTAPTPVTQSSAGESQSTTGAPAGHAPSRRHPMFAHFEISSPTPFVHASGRHAPVGPHVPPVTC